MELTELDALGTAAAIRAGTVSAVEVATAHLDRAERLGPVVGAFARLTPGLALAQAAAVDEAVAAGATSSSAGAGAAPLLGVPCPIKDLNQVAGVGWEAGSAAMRGLVAEVDDDIVGWLRGAGTVVTGKTSTPEFGLPCYTEPDGAPAARTPWDLSRSAGGSSGGAAAAVATGLAPIAQASDGGGSIRIPASACGLVGLKASRGRISGGARADARTGARHGRCARVAPSRTRLSPSTCSRATASVRPTRCRGRTPRSSRPPAVSPVTCGSVCSPLPSSQRPTCTRPASRPPGRRPRPWQPSVTT